MYDTDGRRAGGRLAEGDGLVSAPTTTEGMVMASETKDHIAFSASGCDNWVDLPIDMTAAAEQIGQAPCRDHSHPLMRLTLKVADDPDSKALASLLRFLLGTTSIERRAQEALGVVPAEMLSSRAQALGSPFANVPPFTGHDSAATVADMPFGVLPPSTSPGPV